MSVGLRPWQPMQAAAPFAKKSCGLWHPMHESWSAGRGPAGCVWQVEHIVKAASAGVCGRWQSLHPFESTCSACRSARCLWHVVQSFTTTDGSSCMRWHCVHSVVAWTPMAAK